MKKISKKIIIGIMVFVGIFTPVTATYARFHQTEVEAATTKKGWQLENGKYRYYKDGKYYTGWHYMTTKEGEKTPHWSYFGKDGYLYTGWHYMSKTEGEKTPHWSYFGPNGWLRTGWQTMGTKQNPDGKNKQHMSYFGSNGWLRTGWIQLGKGTSEPDGGKAKHWSYFGSNGWLRTGWVQLGKGTSEPDGNKAKHWSYFGTNGWLRTGLQDMGKGTSNPDGNNGWHQSYFGDNGWLRTNQTVTHVVRGSGYEDIHTYKADSRGWLTFVSVVTKPTNVKKYTITFIEKEYYSNNQTSKVCRYDIPEGTYIPSHYLMKGDVKTSLDSSKVYNKKNIPNRPELWGKPVYEAVGWDKSPYTKVNGNMTFTYTYKSTIYKYYYKWIDSWIKNNLTSKMTAKQKVGKIQKYVTNLKYGYSNSAINIYANGYGDCIAGAKLLSDICNRAGIKAEEPLWVGYNFPTSAGNNHHVAVVVMYGKRYMVESSPGGNLENYFVELTSDYEKKLQKAYAEFSNSKQLVKTN